MSDPIRHDTRTQSATPQVDAARLWSGGLATALVAALVVVVGVFVSRAFLNVPVLAPRTASDLGDSSTFAYAVIAAVAALAATGLLHVLLLATPRPFQFFSWIVVLATVAAAVAPFLRSASQASQVVTGVINLVVGLAVLSLLNGVGRSSLRTPEP
ncbi:DUF6069 family protein [Actinopolymorpha alba]|uniref:DUF6069 family protein n=1 Tax=Actinopolymorpha alba TaxID=533267 RepID=UPI00037066D3|nr:DUF6069 family protein [Actinopolymorpha alba]